MPSFRGTTGKFGLRVVLPAILVLAGAIATVVYSMSQMADEANRIEATLTNRSASAAVDAFVRRIGESHGDYAQWDDAVRNLYGAIDGTFVEENFVSSTVTAVFFDTVFFLDEDGGDLFAYRNGEPVEIKARAAFGPVLDAMMSRLPKDGRTYANETGILNTTWGLAAVAVGPVVPNTDDFDAAPARSRFLVFAKALDEAAVERLAEDVVIAGLRLSDVATPASIALTDPGGETVGWLAWLPRQPGSQANARVGPTVIVMLALLVLVMGVILMVAAGTVREIRRREQQSHYAATHDSLTGLPNRTSLIHGLDAAIGKRDGTPPVLAYLDLDGFKEVNDAYGHETGDRLLVQVADRFRSLSGDHLLARLGGDEFALLVTGSEAREQARSFGRAAIERLRLPFDLDGRVIVVGTSLGIAVADAHDLSAEEWLRRADVAMYHAKQQGPNRAFVYDSVIDTARHERLAIASDLRRAMRSNELTMAYQPVFDARTRRIVAAEALLRWTRPGSGPIPPSRFIAIAEETGLIDELGAWALRRACREALSWKGIRLSVNVSPAQFRNPSFEATVANTLRETGFPASRLELELTETYLIAQPEQAKRAIDTIRGLGVSVALDDFGTGYSSIGYLRRFNFDKLKIDRSLLVNISTDQSAQRLVQATIALADALGLSVTAEGVEMEEEAVMLRAAGCREFQGFLFARPCSAEHFAEFLEAQRLRDQTPEAMSA